MTPAVPPIMCQGQNPADAVFCGNPACHKALGEFAFVTEEFRATSSWLERVADRVTRFTGQPHFVTAHVVWFGAWVALNTGAVAIVGVFDAYPYSLLGIALAIEAILITSFLLISQTRQNAHTEKRAELDYEVNVRSYRKLKEIQGLPHATANRFGGKADQMMAFFGLFPPQKKSPSLKPASQPASQGHPVRDHNCHFARKENRGKLRKGF